MAAEDISTGVVGPDAAVGVEDTTGAVEEATGTTEGPHVDHGPHTAHAGMLRSAAEVAPLLAHHVDVLAAQFRNMAAAHSGGFVTYNQAYDDFRALHTAAHMLYLTLSTYDDIL